MQNLKSLFFVLIAPVVLVACFQANQLKTGTISRSPAVELKKEVNKEARYEGLSVKNAVKSYLLAVNNVK